MEVPINNMAQIQTESSKYISLPSPELKGSCSLEECLQKRRSVREFSRRSISSAQLSQLLWSAQGITGHADRKRTPPSAGGLHPLETYVVVGNVDGLEPGIYKYTAGIHALAQSDDTDVRQAIGIAALNQTWLADAPVAFVFAAIYERTTGKYGDRGMRYVHMDVGFAAENLHLQVVALGMSTVVIGAFDDDEVHQVMGLSSEERPQLIMPVGWAK
jgi:SagB-type dehydrogenase family enzyme